MANNYYDQRGSGRGDRSRRDSRNRSSREVYTTQRPAPRRKKNGFFDVMGMVIMIVALCVFLFSGYTLFGFYKEYKKGSDEYSNLADSYAEQNETENLAQLETEIEAQIPVSAGREMVEIVENGKVIAVPTMKNPIDFEELQRVNEDIVGWLRIRAIDISYPVVQGEDNDFYLHRTFEKVDNFAGCLFVNADNNKDLTDQNTIIYGHNMKNGSMFGKLKSFQEKETYQKSKYFWLFTPDLIYQYRIFGAQVVSKTGTTYQTSFSDEDFDKYLNSVMNNTMVDASDVSVSKDDRIMTLSTCTGDDPTRFVLIGKLAQIYAAK